MKRRNFSGRVNKRRVEALARLKQAEKSDSNDIMIQNLENKIMPQKEAETIRTKKDRSLNEKRN